MEGGGGRRGEWRRRGVCVCVRGGGERLKSTIGIFTPNQPRRLPSGVPGGVVGFVPNTLFSTFKQNICLGGEGVEGERDRKKKDEKRQRRERNRQTDRDRRDRIEGETDRREIDREREREREREAQREADRERDKEKERETERD